MRKEIKTKVKAGDVIGVKKRHHTFVGSGYSTKSVVVLKVINEFDDNEEDVKCDLHPAGCYPKGDVTIEVDPVEGGDHYPQFTVKVDQGDTWRADTYSHRFFDSIIYK